MANLVTVRIYFEHGRKVVGLSFWEKIFQGNFSHYILKVAKDAGIMQAISFQVTAGYLAHHKRLQLGQTEVLSLKYPQCIELTDQKGKIDSFLENHKEQFKNSDISIVEDKISFNS